MPFIELPKKRTNKDRGYRLHGNAAMVAELYNTDLWRRTRRAFLMEHPLCQRCEEQGIITVATEVHHDYELVNATNKQHMYDLLIDPNNLVALCHKCHQDIHAKRHSQMWTNKHMEQC